MTFLLRRSCSLPESTNHENFPSLGPWGRTCHKRRDCRWARFQMNQAPASTARERWFKALEMARRLIRALKLTNNLSQLPCSDFCQIGCFRIARGIVQLMLARLLDHLAMLPSSGDRVDFRLPIVNLTFRLDDLDLPRIGGKQGFLRHDGLGKSAARQAKRLRRHTAAFLESPFFSFPGLGESFLALVFAAGAALSPCLKKHTSPRLHVPCWSYRRGVLAISSLVIFFLSLSSLLSLCSFFSLDGWRLLDGSRLL